MDSTTITLSKKGWSYKLLKFIFEIEPGYMTNLCPYFWLTILGIILLIPKLILWAPLKMWGKIQRWGYHKHLKSLRKSDLYFLRYFNKISSIDGQIFEKLLKRVSWEGKDVLYDAKEYLGLSEEEILEYKNDWERDLEEEYQREDSKEKRMYRTVKFLEKFFEITVWISIVLSGYILSTIIIDIYYSILTLLSESPKDFLTGLGIGTSVLIYWWGFFWSFKLWDQRKEFFGNPWKIAALIPLWIITSPGIIIGWLIPKCFGGLWEIIKLGWIYVKASYHDYCPGINWKEDEN